MKEPSGVERSPFEHDEATGMSPEALEAFCAIGGGEHGEPFLDEDLEEESSNLGAALDHQHGRSWIHGLPTAAMRGRAAGIA
jgi:hypothetical protein